MARKKINRFYISNKTSQVDRIKHMLTLLELDGIMSSFEQLAENGNKDHITLLEFLERLLENEMLIKEDGRVTRWMVQAKFPWVKTLQDFDFSFQPSIDQTLIKDLSTARFVEQGRNVLFVGPPGVGKTHLSIALGVEAIHHGFDTRFFRLNTMIDDITKADTGEKRVKLLATLMRPKLLILDDMDYFIINPQVSEFIFKLVMARYENKLSTIFTSNKDVDDWDTLFGQKQRTSAAVDRIVERADVFMIDGKSYRMKDKMNLVQGTKIPITTA